VIDQPSLKTWAHEVDFRRDFEGRVRGIGPAVYQWLVIRQGVDTVMPDVTSAGSLRRWSGGRLTTLM
jgi:hypothetical protein